MNKVVFTIGVIMLFSALSIIVRSQEETSITGMLRIVVDEIKELRLALVNRECTDYMNLQIPSPEIGLSITESFLFPPSDFNYREFEILELKAGFFCNSNTNESKICIYTKQQSLKMPANLF